MRSSLSFVLRVLLLSMIVLSLALPGAAAEPPPGEAVELAVSADLVLVDQAAESSPVAASPNINALTDAPETALESAPAIADPDGLVPYYVQYTPGADRGALEQALRAAGGRLDYDFERASALAVSLPPAALEALGRRADVRLVEPVPVHRPLTQVIPWNIEMVQALDLWDANRDGAVDTGAPTGANVKICIIDSGFFRAHDDFQGVTVDGMSQISGELWYAPGDGHGTHVAGTLNAVNNNIGVVGVLPGTVQLYIVKIFNNSGVWVTGQSNLGNAATACKNAGANVITMSLGGSYSTTENNIFQDLYDNFGILNVAAAGNDSNNVKSYPASYDSVISVAALREDEVVASFSQYPATSYNPSSPPANVHWDVVELSAGGEGVLSTVPSPNGSVPIYQITANSVTYSGMHIDESGTTTSSGVTALLASGGLCDTTGGGAWSGKIVLCQRGTVSFAQKVNNVRSGGGIGVAIYNNIDGNFSGTCAGACTQPSIPAISLSKADGEALLPSVGANSTLIVDDGSGCVGCTGGYDFYNGTSMATPGISASAALAWSSCGGPVSITNKQLRQLLRDSAKDLSGTRVNDAGTSFTYGAGWDQHSGWGLVQLKDALDLGGQRFGWQTCPPPGPFVVDPALRAMNVCAPADAVFNLQVGGKGFLGSINLGVTGLPAGATPNFSPGTVAVSPAGDWEPASLTIGTAGAAAGVYPLTIAGVDAAAPANTFSVDVSLGLATAQPAAATLTAPANGATGVATKPIFTWAAIADAASYDIQVATDAGFSNIVASAMGLTGATYTPASSLTANTTHYWRVRAGNACGAGAYSSTFSFTTANTIVTCAGTGGNWNATGTWSTGALPTATDQVVIKDGCTVTINTNATIDRLTVGEGASGILLFDNTNTARTLAVNTSVTIASGGTFRVTQTGNTSQTGHQLSVGADLTNNGTLDFHHVGTGGNNGTKGAQIVFTGAADASFTLGGGATTDLRQTTGVTLNKGTNGTSVLTFSPGGTLSVQGANTAGFLAITNGTFKLGGTNSFSNPVFNVAAYTIPAAGGFWLDNPNATVAGLNGSPTNNGTLRISQGTYNIGTSSGDSMGAGAGANYVIEGGTLNVAGRLNTGNAVNYTQSGGTVNVATVGNGSSGNASFGLGNNSVTTISGGVINLVRANTTATLDYGVYGTANITGGTLNVGTSATTTNLTFRLAGQAPGVTLNNTTNNKNATAVGQLNIWGALTVNTGTTLNANGNTVLLLGPGATNNGSIVGTATNSRFDFVGSTAQTYGGTGAFGTTTAPFLEVSIANGSGATLNAAIITNRVNLFEGTFTNSNRFTLGNGGTSYSTVQIGQASATTPGGNLDVSPTFNTGTGGHYILYAQETVARTTGPEIPPSRTAYYVSVDNTNGVTLAGGGLTIANTSAQTASQLLLTNGRFALGANNLIIVNNAVGGSPFTADKMIVADGGGALCKRYTANSSFLFPIGDATGTPEYAPATLNFTAGSYGSSAQACAKLTDAKHPTMPSSDYITRYWTVTQSNISGFTCQPTFTYSDADIAGSEANMWGAKWDTIWTVLNVVNQSANQFTASVNSFSDFSAGNPGPLAVTLASFTVAATADGVALAWETVSETDNAGFNVYRTDASLAARGDGDLAADPLSMTGWVRLNPALIPSAAPGSSEGHAYTWTDATAAPGAAYWYQLEDVALDGTVTRHAPVTAAAAAGAPNAVGLAGPLVVTSAAVEPSLAGLAALALLALAGAGVRRRKR